MRQTFDIQFTVVVDDSECDDYCDVPPPPWVDYVSGQLDDLLAECDHPAISIGELTVTPIT